MSYETSASYADTVEIDFVKAQCPEEWEKFNLALLAGEIDFDAFCQCTSIEDELDADEPEAKAIDEAYEALQDAFRIKVALTLNIVYNEKDDRGDELEGGSFAVDGVWVLSEGGRNHKDSIERLFWTNGG
jgi:hypothetical protein